MTGDVSALTGHQVAALLRYWADGSRSATSAVELLITTGQVSPSRAMRTGHPRPRARR